MKLYRILAILLISSLCFIAQGQTNQSAEEKNQNALLWKLNSDALDQPSYLFGTIHLIPEQDYIFSDTIEQAFDACKQVAFEINMEDMMDFGKQMELMMGAFMPDGITLKDLLSEKEYALVNDHFEEMGMPLFLFERIKPMFLSVFATGEGSPGMFTGAGGMKSYEMELMEEAKANDLKVHGLETAAYQMSMFDSIPYEVQANILVETIKAGNEGNDEMDLMVRIYKNKDLDSMYKMLRTDTEGIGPYEKILIENRNRNWIPVIEELISDHPTFIAVGAGHLGGPVGVIALLREKGYTVEPVW